MEHVRQIEYVNLKDILSYTLCKCIIDNRDSIILSQKTDFIIICTSKIMQQV